MQPTSIQHTVCATAQHSTAQRKFTKLLGFCLLILFFFSTNESKGQACEPCGSGAWTTIVYTKDKNCTVYPASPCKMVITFQYRVVNCTPLTQLQFKIDKINFSNGCYAQNPCFDLSLYAEAMYWTIDKLYSMGTPGNADYSYGIDLLIGLPDNCLRNVESFSTGCVETVQRAADNPWLWDGEEYYYEMRNCWGNACCRVGWVMCPVNFHTQSLDLWRRNNSYYFSNNCNMLNDPFTDMEGDDIIWRSGCLPVCEELTNFPIIQD